MKKAYTLIELIFVIIIIGIMSAVGASAFKPTYLRDDTNFIQAKIKQAQFLGIGYNHIAFGGASLGVDYKSGCIKLKKSAFSEDTSKKDGTSYILHIDDFDYGTICFDATGRPHEDDFNGTLLTSQLVINLKYSSKERNISIEPITGYVIITK